MGLKKPPAGDCVGCFACYNVCPAGAIEMVSDDEGFYIAQINGSLCKTCKLCSDVCPVVNLSSESDKLATPKAFVAWSLDDAIRRRSSSGGIYSELAREFIENCGTVFAVGWGETWLPLHVEITEMKDISHTIGSKYVQSYVGEAPRKVLHLLKSGQRLLFVGTPCQIAGLKNLILKAAEAWRDNITLVDLVCHGVSSPLVFRKYISETFGKKRVVSVSLRDKSKGWTVPSVKIEMIDGQTYLVPYYLDSFFMGYLKNLYLATTCYKCPFSRLPRKGDVTLGDFWGVPEKFRSEEGISVVLANSEKGLDLILKLTKKGRIFVDEVHLETATKANPRIMSGSWDMPRDRGRFFHEVKEKNWGYMSKTYTRPYVGTRKILLIASRYCPENLKRVLRKLIPR